MEAAVDQQLLCSTMYNDCFCWWSLVALNMATKQSLLYIKKVYLCRTSIHNVVRHLIPMWACQWQKQALQWTYSAVDFSPNQWFTPKWEQVQKYWSYPLRPLSPADDRCQQNNKKVRCSYDTKAQYSISALSKSPERRTKRSEQSTSELFTWPLRPQSHSSSPLTW